MEATADLTGVTKEEFERDGQDAFRSGIASQSDTTKENVVITGVDDLENKQTGIRVDFYVVVPQESESGSEISVDTIESALQQVEELQVALNTAFREEGVDIQIEEVSAISLTPVEVEEPTPTPDEGGDGGDDAALVGGLTGGLVGGALVLACAFAAFKQKQASNASSPPGVEAVELVPNQKVNPEAYHASGPEPSAS